jgi:hypothetical protein
VFDTILNESDSESEPENKAPLKKTSVHHQNKKTKKSTESAWLKEAEEEEEVIDFLDRKVISKVSSNG